MSSLSGGYNTCFLVGTLLLITKQATLMVQNQPYVVQVDTGSTDTVLPYSGLNTYSGPTVSYAIPAGQENQMSQAYGDGSYWYGYASRISVGLKNTTFNATSPIILMTTQSSRPVFASGSTFQGLMGVAFPSLSYNTVPPITVLDAWVATNKIKNQIAFHGCPYALGSKSWLDFGNETPYTGCNSNQVASVMMPTKSYYNIDVAGMAVNGVPIAMPDAFQQNNQWSFADSCTSSIMVPQAVLKVLKANITSSGGISSLWMNSGYVAQWLNGQVLIPFDDSDLTWSKFPNLSITINSRGFNNAVSTVTLTLGPRQYIQADDAGNYAFLVASWGDRYGILGLPFFSAYHIVVDRDSGKLSFQLGCACESSVDGYPKISTNGPTIENWSLAAPVQHQVVLEAVVQSESSAAAVSTTSQESPAPTGKKIADWITCTAIDSCASAGFQCCYGNQADYEISKHLPSDPEKTTCRPPSFCYSAPGVSIQARSNIKGVSSAHDFAPYIKNISAFHLDIAYDRGIHQVIVGSVEDHASPSDLDNVAKFQSKGGSVWISFGSPSGTPKWLTTGASPAASASSLNDLINSYQQRIESYSPSSVDFYYAGAGLTNQSVVDLQSKAIKALQTVQSISVSLTVPVTPSGLSHDALYVIQSAVQYGVRIGVVNILAMDFGSDVAPNAATSHSTYSIAAAQAVRDQLVSLGLDTTQIGITSRLGQGDTTNEFFGISDTLSLVSWAKKNSWVSLLSFYALDQNVKEVSHPNPGPWSYAAIFSTFGK
ncbi:hypothetical protein HDU91_000054 [Kappamyces sp. JEL0680]|nr:hypothetical protein HDU91_000054 [Kappamyces sp. JEL0680]